MATINLGLQPTDHKGKPLSVDGNQNTLGDFLYYAVATATKEDPTDVAGKRKLVSILNKTVTSGEVEFTKEEIDVLVSRCAAVYSALHFGAIDSLLQAGK